MSPALGEVEPATWEELVAHLTYEDPGAKPKERRRLGYSYLFRGVSDAKRHTLVPSLGRSKSYLRLTKATSRASVERRILSEFRYRFASELPGKVYDDWDILAFGQHLGVPTRLLDWSTSPMIALFFALAGQTTEDAAVYCVTLSKDHGNNEVSGLERSTLSPFDVASVRRFSPPLSFPRLRNQRGVFTVQPDPATELPLAMGKKVVVHRSLARQFRAILFQYGIDYAYVYPDEEGIGRQVKWHLESRTGLGPHWAHEEQDPGPSSAPPGGTNP